MKPVTEVVYSSMPLDESQNIFQSVLAKQSCSVCVCVCVCMCVCAFVFVCVCSRASVALSLSLSLILIQIWLSALYSDGDGVRSSEGDSQRNEQEVKGQRFSTLSVLPLPQPLWLLIIHTKRQAEGTEARQRGVAEWTGMGPLFERLHEF